MTEQDCPELIKQFNDVLGRTNGTAVRVHKGVAGLAGGDEFVFLVHLGYPQSHFYWMLLRLSALFAFTQVSKG